MENRLNLPCEAGGTDRHILDGMVRVVSRMAQEWGLPVFTEQGEMAVTHMANALMRSRRGDVIAPLGAELYDELVQSPHWQAILQTHHLLLGEFSVELHTAEEGYLLANLYGLWMAGQEAAQR